MILKTQFKQHTHTHQLHTHKHTTPPSHDCYEKMLFFGIKKIAFTTETEDGDIKVFETPICDYVPSVVTTGQRWISRGIID